MPRILADAPAAAIVQRTAALFAEHGVDKTSLQDIASALDVSKAAVLHHFGSRVALEEAVFATTEALLQQTVEPLRTMPEGRARDIAAITAIVDCALANPGPVSLVVGSSASDDVSGRLAALERTVHAAFSDSPTSPSADRLVRLHVALAAAGVVAVTAHRRGVDDTWRASLIAACANALGHLVSHIAPSRPEEHA